MNLAQMRTQLRDILTAGGGVNTAVGSDDFWSTSELNTALNNAQADLYKIIRRARSDYFTRILRTTDTPLLIKGQLFDPATLKWVPGTGNYQLPPDFVRMKLITDLSEDRVRLIGSDISRNEFRVLMNASGANTAREFLYDILGIRTFVVRPIPDVARDFELIYEKTLDNLVDWSTGTLSINEGSTTVTFSGSANIQNRLSAGMELIVGSDGTTQTTPDPNEQYPVIKTIDSATQVTLAAPYLGSSVSNYAYTASPVSEIPLQHHSMMVFKAAVYAFKKGTNPSVDAAGTWQNEYDAMVPALVNDVETRQGSDMESTQPFLEDLYDV